MKRTARKKLQQLKQRMSAWIKASRHLPGRAFFDALKRKLVGHYNYFGLRSNEKALHSFYGHVIGTAFKWRNRRGGKRSSFTWGRFKQALRVLSVPLPHVVERRREHAVFA